MRTSSSDISISIIIPNHNGAHLLSPCLDSIRNQSYKTFDVVVVDNGSHDHSLELLNRYAHEIRVIKLDRNIGFGRAVNLGIHASDGDLIFVLNNDTRLHHNCLAEVARGSDLYPQYGFFAPKICEFDNPNRVYAGGLMFSDRGYGNRSNRSLFQRVRNNVDVFGACGAAAVYRRDILTSVGYFNEDFFFLYEDLELSFRHQLRGHKCLYLPAALVYHHGSVTLHKLFSQAVYEAVKNSLATLLTCVPTKILAECAWGIARFYCAFWFLLIRNGYSREVISGLVTTLVRTISLFKHRRDLQSHSSCDLNYIRELLYRGPIHINLPNKVVTL
jgi:GT2 family glycosyltransferase